MDSISVPIVHRSLADFHCGWNQAGMICFFLYVYMRRRFMAAHADMRDIANLATSKTQLEAENKYLKQRMFAHKG